MRGRIPNRKEGLAATATPKRSRPRRFVVPLGVNVRRQSRAEWRAMAVCSGMSWSSFVFCAILHEVYRLALQVNIDPYEAPKLPRSTLAEIGRRVKLAEDAADRSGGWFPRMN